MTKKSSTKKALVASVLSLMLCFTMLLGTTFAWFTDSVTSAGNIIQSGNLDVEMYWADGAKAVPTDDAGWTDASKGAIFNYALWEPGYVQVRHIKIANEGSLALNYKVNVVANGTVSDLSNVIDVYYVDPAVQVVDRTALNSLPKLGTLTEVLAKLGETGNGSLEAGDADTITIAFKMQESAGNEYMSKSIGTDFSIQLLATQKAYEADSFGKDYDKDAQLPTVSTAYVGENAPATTIGNVDNEEDVSVTVPAGAPEGIYQVTVSNKNTTEENGITTFSADIDLMKDGVKVQAGGTTRYLVKINIGTDKVIAKVLHNGEEIQNYNYSSDSGIIEFETASFSPFSVIFEENKDIKVNSAEELKTALSNMTEPAVINAEGVELDIPDQFFYIPGGATLKGATLDTSSRAGSYIVAKAGAGDTLKFENCTFNRSDSGANIVAAEADGPDNVVFENCVFYGPVMPNMVDNPDGKMTFINCTFKIAKDGVFPVSGYVNCMGGTHTFNGCTFDFAGGSTMGSNQYVRWNAVNSYSERYSTAVILEGCTFINCGTQRYGANSTLTIK